MYKCNIEIVSRILEELPSEKRATLGKALDRNFILTSVRALSMATLTIYKEGFNLKLDGTRCCFNVFVKDNDGEFEFIRKPKESSLHKLYEQCCNMNESDYYGIE